MTKYMNKMGKPDIHNPKRLENIGVSDLWFNWDHSNCVKLNKEGQFAGYDIEALTKEAESFLRALQSAGLKYHAHPWELIEDLHARL